MDEEYDMKPTQTVALKEVDSVEIVSLIDNSIDFLSSIEKEGVQQVREWVKERRGEEWFKEHFHPPMAEHGFSMLVRVFCDNKMHEILFDTGGSSEGVVTNAIRMGIDLSDIGSIVLSHGHYDHFGGLLAVLKVVNKENLPIIVHEDMFKTRGVADLQGKIRSHPDFPSDNQVKPARYIQTKKPYFLADNTILVTGEIPHKTDFEKGFPQHRILADGEWLPDPRIRDDRALVIKVREKGLVLVSGCAHAGIVNTALYAQQTAGLNKMHAIIGGFHLAGKEFECGIDQTVRELKLINPSILVPSHCTGWKAICRFASAMPAAVVWNSVGNLYKF